MEKLMLTPEEVADALGIGRSTVYDLMRMCDLQREDRTLATRARFGGARLRRPAHAGVDTMSRRANGEGSIYQRQDGRWTGATYVLRPDGGRQRRQVYGRTRAEAAEKLNELIVQTARGIPLAGTAWTVESYARQWLASVTSNALRAATVSNYSWVVTKYLVPILGSVRLDRLTPADVRRLQSAVGGTGVSARTVQLAHAVLRTMIAEAVREEYISRNVATLVRAPRQEKVEVGPWSADEVTVFRQASARHRLGALFMLAYSVGLRRGELLGLRWADVNLAEGMLHVRQTLQRLGSDQGLVVGPPKSARSRRSIPLPRVMVDELVAHRARQDEERTAAGALWHEAGLVFTTAIGTNLEPSNLRRDFERLISEAGVRRIRFHDLRHTCASLLFAQGVPPRVVMDQLGHSTLSITTDLYAHVMPSALVDAAAAMDALLSVPAATIDHDESGSS